MAGRMRRRRRSILTMVAIVAYVAFAGASASVVRAGSDGRGRPARARVRTRRARGRGVGVGRGDPARRRPGAHPRRGLPAVRAGDGRPDRLGHAVDRLDRSRRVEATCPGWLAESLGVSLAAQAATLPIVLASFGRLADPVAGRQPRGRAARRSGDGGRARRDARRLPGPRRRAAAGRERPGGTRLGLAADHGRDRRRDGVAAVRERDPAGAGRRGHGGRRRSWSSPSSTSAGEGATSAAGRRRGTAEPRSGATAKRPSGPTLPPPEARGPDPRDHRRGDGRRRRQPAQRRRAGQRARCRAGRRDPRRGLARRAAPHRWRPRSRPAARRARPADPAVGPADRRGDPHPPARGPRGRPRPAAGSLPGAAGLRARHARTGTRLRGVARRGWRRRGRRCAWASPRATGSRSTTSTSASCGRSAAGSRSMPPDGGTGINNVSVVLLGAVGDFRFLLAGDVEEAIDSSLLAERLPRLDLLKVAHHGSRTATTQAFVDAVRPRIAIASAGTGNPYGHPARATLERLSGAGRPRLPDRSRRDGGRHVRGDRADGPGRRRPGGPGELRAVGRGSTVARVPVRDPARGPRPRSEAAEADRAGRRPAGRYAQRGLPSSR